ncbi:MAG: glycosyltransferase family 4 protein [Pseudomonadota bacterium]
MNILLLTNKSAYFKSQFGGAESSIRLLGESLAESGDRVFYITRDRERTLSLGTREHCILGVNVKAVSFLGRLRRFRLIKKIQERKVKNIVREAILKENVKVVYCFYEIENLKLLSSLKDEGLKFSIVMRMAGMLWYEECIKSPEKIKEYEYYFNRIDSVNYIHPALIGMARLRLDELKMNVQFRHEFSADIGSSFAVGRKKSYPNKENRRFELLMASRFSEYQKRQDVLVDAMSIISQDLPIRLTLVGNGTLKKEIEEKVFKLGLNERVLIKPFIEQDKLWACLQEFDLLCHATDYEGLGKIVIESMAVGLPVLVSNVKPLCEYVVEGETGFLVDNNPKYWAKKIEFLYHNQSCLADASKKSMSYIANHFDPGKNVMLYRNAFIEVLASDESSKS